jgi:hypothetical protein
MQIDMLPPDDYEPTTEAGKKRKENMVAISDMWVPFSQCKVAVGWVKDDVPLTTCGFVNASELIGIEDVSVEKIRELLLDDDSPMVRPDLVAFKGIKEWLEDNPYELCMTLAKLADNPRRNDQGFWSVALEDPLELGFGRTEKLYGSLHPKMAKFISDNYDIGTSGVVLIDPRTYKIRDRDTGLLTDEEGIRGNLFAFVPIPMV